MTQIPTMKFPTDVSERKVALMVSSGNHDTLNLCVVPRAMFWGVLPEAQDQPAEWLLYAYDCGTKKDRMFLMRHIRTWRPLE